MNNKLLFIALFGFLFLERVVYSQNIPPVANGTLIAEVPMHFTEGYMFLTIPVIDTNVYGKAVTLSRSFILDPAASSDGSYMPDDSLVAVTNTRKFYFPVSSQRTLTADLIPTLAKGIYKRKDTSFFGVLGYGFIKRYITVLNFFERKVSFYSPEESPMVWHVDSSALIIPYFDDAILDHCHCPFPTMWMEGKSKFLKDGRVHLSLAERQSSIFKHALDPRTVKFFETKEQKDSLAGKPKEPQRLDLQTFELAGKDLSHNTLHRAIADLPPIFRNLNIFIMGTLAVDVLREFSQVIIDPPRERVIFLR